MSESTAQTVVSTPLARVPAPRPPTDRETTLYLRRYPALLILCSVISFTCTSWSASRLLVSNPGLRWTLPYLILTALYFFISLVVNIHKNGFDLNAHRALVKQYADVATEASVDIFLPTAGEEIEVLINTWNGVRALCRNRKGRVTVFVLDDADRPEVAELARMFGFQYSVRDNRGWFKKAGNLRHGYNISRPLGHEFVVIFDADFRPRSDFLDQMLPYFYENPKVGLVQSPQYFDVHYRQSWLQRGAGAVQEFFYRYSQVARQSHGAAICVGTNAVYRRAALDTVGGTALIEHSEDVHTGFNMRMQGWSLTYVPLVLAKGICPDSMEAFFKQQYRWCMGSMSLLGSAKFWRTSMPIRARFSYFSGFLYYIHTAVSLFFTPVIPLTLLTVDAHSVSALPYLLLLPAALYTFVLFPTWHTADYGIEAWAVKHVYSWAHLVALIDLVRGAPMGWVPTGARDNSAGVSRYRVFRVSQALFGFGPSLVWALFALYRVAVMWEVVFLPLCFAGMFAVYITGRVALFRRRAEANQGYYIVTGDATHPLVAFGEGEKNWVPSLGGHRFANSDHGGNALRDESEAQAAR